jgi:hypothetical protein
MAADKKIDMTFLLEHFTIRPKVATEDTQNIQEFGKRIDTPGGKTKVKAYFDDIDLVPTTFSFDIAFTVTFDCQKIREDFSTSAPEPPEDEPMDQPDAETELQIQKALANEKPAESRLVSAEKVDYSRFYRDVIKKKISAYAVENKLRDLKRVGIFVIPDFTVQDVNYATEENDVTLINNLARKDRKVSVAKPISMPFSYNVSVRATNELKKYDEKALQPIMQKVVEVFETSILVDTDYYRFTGDYEKKG